MRGLPLSVRSSLFLCCILAGDLPSEVLCDAVGDNFPGGDACKKGEC